MQSVPPLRDRHDVLVVGAGPAGVATAIHLHRRGIKVTVIDKATFPRDKCCGDGLTTGALRLLEELNFEPNTVAGWTVCHDVVLRSPSGKEVRLRLPADDGQFAAIAPRSELDAALVRHARNLGIEVIEGVSFECVVGNECDGVTVSLAPLGERTFSSVVAADGMWSTVRKALGANIPQYLGDWHAFRQYATNVTGPASEKLFVWFDEDLLPGYAWSFPLSGGRANVGFGILRGSKSSPADMKTQWQSLLQRPHVRRALGKEAEMVDRVTAWPIPARVTSATLSVPGFLFVGDAACVTDSLTGEGIGQALLSGKLAAQAIGQSAPGDLVAPGRRYEQAMREEFFADHRMSIVLGKILAHPLGARGALRAANLSDWTRRNFVRWMFEDEPRSIITTPSRWHRRFLKRPGAFVSRDTV
ncbi:MAG: NAD(P)/FAD-dependent oxidoreductase [Ilumatobacteraceae bacterium]